MLAWAEENSSQWGDGESCDACVWAAYDGKLDVLIWARDHGVPWNTDVFAFAASGGNMEVLQYLNDHGCPCNGAASHSAAGSGHLHVLRWLMDEGDASLLQHNAHGSAYDASEWIGLFTRSCSSVTYNAALSDHLEVLQWARHQGCSWDENGIAAAARNGHLEVLKWMRDNHCPWNSRTCEYAARNGHLELLKFVREHDCPWDEKCCTAAAQGGHLETLQCRLHRCPWTADVITEAAKNKHLDLVRWARDHGCKCPIQYEQLLSLMQMARVEERSPPRRLNYNKEDIRPRTTQTCLVDDADATPKMRRKRANQKTNRNTRTQPWTPRSQILVDAITTTERVGRNAFD